MNLRISRQSLYLLLISFVLLVAVLLFSFLVLIPKGKEYRIMRLEEKKHALSLMQYRQWHDETYEKLKNLQAKNKRIITAFDNTFNAERFVKANRHHFESLQLTKVQRTADEEPFSVYEVNASSKIDSPQTFYSFLEGINKSDWIVGVNFPINFERDDTLIRSSFRMKVYSITEE